MDASYFSEPGGKIRAAGYFYLLNCNDKIFNNGAIPTLLTIIKHVMLSASKAKLPALYYGCKLAAPLETHSRNSATFNQLPPCHHQQHHYPRPNNGNNDTQGFQINGSTLSLAEMLAHTTSNSISVVEEYTQSHQLSQQTSCTKTSSKCLPIFGF
jgi:hypothetical protein